MFWQGQIFDMARHAPTPKTKNIVGILRAKPSFTNNLKYTSQYPHIIELYNMS